MRELIEIFKMEGIKIDTKIKLIKKTGEAINFKYASNITDELVSELVELLQDQKLGQ